MKMKRTGVPIDTTKKTRVISLIGTIDNYIGKLELLQDILREYNSPTASAKEQTEAIRRAKDLAKRIEGKENTFITLTKHL